MLYFIHASPENYSRPDQRRHAQERGGSAFRPAWSLGRLYQRAGGKGQEYERHTH